MHNSSDDKKTPLSNYHTHTTFCDGADSPQTVVEKAVSKGFTQLGFSSHALYPFASAWHLPLNQYEPYCAEIRRLAQQYADKIDIFLGFEADYFPPFSKPQKSMYARFLPDYLIGAVHFLSGEKNENGCFTVDGSANEVTDGIQNMFGGDAKRAVCAYFAAQRDMAKSGGFDIIAHADVIRKRNGELRFFDESEPWYKRELQETAKIFAASGKIVEINTGGIARGTMKDVYPSADFLSMLYQCKVPVTINSDAHTADGLDCAFDLATTAAKNAGYQEIVFLKKSGSQSVWESRLINAN